MTIRIACTCDGAYAPHTGAMLYTLFSSNRAQTFSVDVLYQTLDEDDRRKLAEVAAPFKVELAFVHVPEALLAGFPREMFHPSCWYRVLLPELVKADKILYLDSDLLVLGDIGPLWNTPLGGHLFAAVTNPLYPFLPYAPERSLGLPDRRSYLNSGVLLMDLRAMRETAFIEKVRDYAMSHPGNPYPEQDALSALYHRSRLALHPRWNVQSTLYDLPAHQLPFDAKETREAREAPAILHFSGPFKPWVYLCNHPLRRLYIAARDHTPWPAEPPMGRTLKSMLLRPLPLLWRYRLHQLKQRGRGLLAGLGRASAKGS